MWVTPRSSTLLAMAGKPHSDGHDGPAVVRVLIVDDSEAIRVGLGRLLGSRPYCEVVGAVEDMESALDHVRAARPHVVLLDFSMPRVDPLALIGELAVVSPRPAVLMLSALANEASTRRAIAAGAVGWVLKDADPEALFAALLRAARSAQVVEDAGAVVEAALADMGDRDEAAVAARAAHEGAANGDARTVRALLRGLHGVPGGVGAEDLARSAVVPLRVALRHLRRLEARRPAFVARAADGERYVLTAAGEQELERLECHIAGAGLDETGERPPVGCGAG
ncbi:MAG: hypothetical protein QOC64_1222 [Solirubrobacteraceae bacterium]|nr:hypothetical protein [Solirubrobacteraceae bacterium]